MSTGGMLLLFVWFIGIVLSVLFFIAQMRLFTISTTLKEIRDELRASRQGVQPSIKTEAEVSREKVITQRILDGSLVPTVVGAKQTVRCGKCGVASTLRCKNCSGCEHCCRCETKL
jgi:hypothetical protein